MSNQQEQIAEVMDIVNEWESSDKSNFIEDLLTKLSQSNVIGISDILNVKCHSHNKQRVIIL